MPQISGPNFPATRQELGNYCLRKLGEPVISVNIDPDQVDDRLSDALQFFQEYHYDGVIKTFFSHCVTPQDQDRGYIDMTEASGTASVVAGSNTVLGNATGFARDMAANVTQLTINGETKIVENITDNLTMTMNSNFSNTANSVAIFVTQAPDSIIGVTGVFPISSAATINMFDLRYQLRLHELYDFTSTSYINFVLTQNHLRTLEMLFTGLNMVRFNRHMNRLYIDWDWKNIINTGEYILIEAYKIVDPDSYVSVYNDRLVKQLATAYIKQQWGMNMKKYGGVKLPGGVELNGQIIFDEATKEIEDTKEEIRTSFMEPPIAFIMG